ncbi:transposable element Tcb2 transposase [Trichonephila clavipes]|nr:transposable element Tcb2 transposase [Trichonephila clavipes]
MNYGLLEEEKVLVISLAVSFRTQYVTTATEKRASIVVLSRTILQENGTILSFQTSSENYNILTNVSVHFRGGTKPLVFDGGDVGVAIVPRTIFRHLSEANLKSKRPFRALSLNWNIVNYVYSGAKSDQRETSQIGKMLCLVMNPGFSWGQMITVYGCGGALGAITYDSWSTVMVMRGILMGQRYVDDILRPHVGPVLNGLPGAIFHQDNPRPHTARVAQDFLRHFQTLPWPAGFPDLTLWSTCGIC